MAKSPLKVTILHQDFNIQSPTFIGSPVVLGNNEGGVHSYNPDAFLNRSDGLRGDRPLNYFFKNSFRNNSLGQSILFQPPIVFNVKPLSDCFVGRAYELSQIASNIKKNIVVLTGLGGVGKSELARKYAHLLTNDATYSVVWFDAKSGESLENSIRCFDRDTFTRFDHSLGNASATVIIREIYANLAREKVLFVFDDAQSYKLIAPYLPRSHQIDGHTFLVTSNRNVWVVPGISRVEITDFPVDIGVKFVQESLSMDESHAENENATKLVQLLRLPLALRQAVAYISTLKLEYRVRKLPEYKISDYLDRFLTKPRDLIKRDFTEENDKTVYKTLMVAIDKLKDEGFEDAILMLNIISYFSPTDIPEEIFSHTFGMETLVNITLSLEKYLLATPDMVYDKAYLNMHGLVQLVMRSKIIEERNEEIILEQALGILEKNTSINDVIKKSQNTVYAMKDKQKMDNDTLLEKQARKKMDSLSNHTISVWHHAYKYKNLIRMFLSGARGASTKMLGMIIDGDQLAIVDEILNEISREDFNCIMFSSKLWIKNLNVKLARILCEKGLDVNYRTENGSNLLHMASTDGHFESVEFLVKDKSIEPTTTDNNGCTPLYQACLSGHLQIVQYLIVENPSVMAATTNNHGWTILHAATQKGHIDIVKFLVENAHVDVNSRIPESGLTPVHISAGNGQIEIVKYFLDNENVDVNVIDYSKRTPLLLAVEKGHLDVVKFLAEERRAEIAIADIDDWTPVHRAAFNGHSNVLQYLIKNLKADVKIPRSITEWSPLHLAAAAGSMEIIEFLVEKKRADVNLRNNFGMTPLHAASETGELQVIRRLVEKYSANINAVDNEGWTPLFRAIEHGQMDIMKYFLDKNVVTTSGNKFKYTILHFAGQYGHLDIVKYLIENKFADIAATEVNGYTVTCLAAFMGHIHLLQYLVDVLKVKDDVNKLLRLSAPKGHREIVEYLIKSKGADVNAVDEDGYTVLHEAAENGQLELIKYLVDEHGADCYLKNKKGWSLLHLAADDGAIDLVRYLVEEKNLKITDGDLKSETPIHFAARSGHLEVLQYFIDEKGSQSADVDYAGRTFLHLAAMTGQTHIIEYFVKNSVLDITVTDDDARTPLHLAAANGHFDIVKCLADENSVKNTDLYGISPLHLAAQNGRLENFKFLLEFVKRPNETLIHHAVFGSNKEIIRLVIEKLTKYEEICEIVNAKDSEGNTPLMWAAHSGKLVGAEALLDIFSDGVNVQNRHGETALHMASRSGNQAMIDLLLKYHANNNIKNFEGKLPEDVFGVKLVPKKKRKI